MSLNKATSAVGSNMPSRLVRFSNPIRPISGQIKQCKPSRNSSSNHEDKVRPADQRTENPSKVACSASTIKAKH